MLTYVSRNKEYARQLRGRQTDAEQRLWLHLRRDQLGVRFYRQKPLGPYIVDFHAPKARLVVELDGSQHADDATIKEKDAVRDAWLKSQGLTVLRFDDRQALSETEAVLEVIFQAVRDATGGEIPPQPPFFKGGSQSFVSNGCAPHSEKGGKGGLFAASAPPLQKGGQGGFSDVSTSDISISNKDMP